MLARGDIVSPLAPSMWAGQRMRVVVTRMIYVRGSKDGLTYERQVVRCRQVDPAPAQTAPGSPIGGHLIDFYDNEVVLVATAEDVP